MAEKKKNIEEIGKKIQKRNKKDAKWAKIPGKKIEVDFRKTDFDDKTIGIRLKEQKQAKIRQFPNDMEIYGAVKIDSENAGFIGFRTNQWKKDRLMDGQLKRLVIHYFNENYRWIASIEEDTIRGLLRSVGKKEPLPVFNIFYKGISKIFPLERIEKEWGQEDKLIVPLILEEESDKIEFFIFSENRFILGKGWIIFRPNAPKKTLAVFEDKKFKFGRKFEIKIYDIVLAKKKIFVNTLILFGALLKFWEEVVEDIKFSDINYRKDNFSFQPDIHELELLENPQRYSR